MIKAVPEPTAPTIADMEVAEETSRLLGRLAAPGRSLRMTSENGAASKSDQTIEIPAAAVPLIQAVLTAMAKGDAVSVVPIHAELTTHQAASLLGVSRPFVIKLIEERALPCHKVGRHRRIVLRDLLDYKRRMHADRQKVLDELTAEAQRLNLRD